ncbi:hypothetical protein ABW19_dt0202385 [Dactylella cylindrospora]|nr:hypothetical protein ABW19_dt0202385 [Dactylella cylindrospora]
MPLLQNAPSTIHRIIDDAPEQRLRFLLHAICHSDPRIAEQIQKLHNDMFTPLPKILESQSSDSRKRKAEAKLEVCMVCLDSFDEESNHDTACRSHPGAWEADMDHDMWADMWDDDYQGRDPNHEDFFTDVPEAFIWDCCNQRGDTPGCEVARHVGRPRDLLVGPLALTPADAARAMVSTTRVADWGESGTGDKESPGDSNEEGEKSKK